ncbi:MAG: hypothetical protein LC777_05880 [Actinobacteria bacterium]|nr:hypothetical protein [Actinomycetota bacterium]
MVSLAHDGDKRYRETFDLIYRRESDGPNDIWQADHTELDLWVRDASGRPARPWLTVIEDDHSRAVAGYAVSLDAPSAMNTALALRHAIWRKTEPAADVRAERATQRADAADERARDQRAALDVELAQLRLDHEQRVSALTDRAQAAEIAQQRADAALSAERQLRTQLQTQLSSTEQRLAGAEKARDAAIAAVEQAAKRPPRSSR